MEEYRDDPRRLTKYRGLPVHKSGMKNKQLGEIIKNNEIDVLLIQEINIHWRAVDEFDSWYERMKMSRAKKNP